MEITVLRKMRYENTFIYVMQFGYKFQYLFSWNGEIYQNNTTIKPTLRNRIKVFLGKETKASEVYTPEQLEEGEKVMLSGAMESIDKLISDGRNERQEKKKQQRDIEKAERNVEIRSKEKCVWQTTEAKEGAYYWCLVHGVAVKLQDGVKPIHDIVSPFMTKTRPVILPRDEKAREEKLKLIELELGTIEYIKDDMAFVKPFEKVNG